MLSWKMRSVRTVLLCVVTIVAFGLYVGFAGHQGQAKAEAVCASVHIGQDKASARATLVASEGYHWTEADDPEYVAVDFKGAFVETYACKVGLADGEVTNTEILHLD